MIEKSCDNKACPDHNRVNFREMNTERKDLILVDYVGNYVVQTITAPELSNRDWAIADALGVVDIPQYVTAVSYVGKCTLIESIDYVPADEFVRWLERHDKFKGAPGIHDMVTECVRGGLIDLDTPLTAREQSIQILPRYQCDDDDDEQGEDNLTH
jgi:hypothetical protein